MRFGKSDPPENTDGIGTPDEVDTETATDAAAALALAEAEAAAAEATAAAARARAEEIRLSKQSAAEQEAATDESDADDDTVIDEPADVIIEESADVEDTEDATTDGSVGTEAPKRGVGSALRWAAATLTVLAIGALATISVLMVIQHRGVQADQRREAEYAAAARQSVVTLMSLDFNSVDEDVKRIIDNSTGDFRKEFEGQAEDFAKVAQESKVVTEAAATAAAVESMTDNEAVVLVTATSTVTNTAGAKQEPRNWRLTVNLTRDGDQIKMSKVEFAP